MDTAKCTLDGVIYSALDFSRLSASDLERKRQFLQCPECGGPAFFRDESHNGRAACFGARPHVHGCSLAALDYLRALYGDDTDQDALAITASKIVVDFEYGSLFQQVAAEDSGRGSRSVVDVCWPNATTSRRFSSLLRSLIASPAFQNSDQAIEIHGSSDITVREFFVPLLSVTDQYVGLYRGFWGLLSDVRLSDDKATIWFNSGGQDTISFCLDSKYINDFTQRYRVRDEEDLAGSYILVIGLLRLAQNGKLYCIIDGVEHMALRLT